MTGKPPPRPPGPTRKVDLVELRIANLRRELEAETEPVSQAAILYQVGALYEHELERVAKIAQSYMKMQEAAEVRLLGDAGSDSMPDEEMISHLRDAFKQPATDKLRFKQA